MTTIAYRDGVLAGDTRETDEDMIWNDCTRKVWRLKDGTLYGGAGDAEGCTLLLEALRKGNLLPEMPESAKDVSAIRVTPDGKVYFYEGFTWRRMKEGYLAIGSGRKPALALLRYGASAVDAVKGAMSIDMYSGGRVKTVKLRKLK
jgi:20S proteasome alpha/beta subunit